LCTSSFNMRFTATTSATLGCLLASFTACQAQSQPPYSWLPPDIHYTDLVEMEVSFGGNWVRTGEQIGINGVMPMPAIPQSSKLYTISNQHKRAVPASPPTLGFLSDLVNVSTETLYLLAMVDPDAPAPANPTRAQILHWIQPGLTLDPVRSADNPFIWTLRNHSAPIVPYARPSPPNYSPAHRYIELLFQQPSQTFVMPDAFSGFSATNRTNFNVTLFAAAAGLGDPVAATYFLVSNQTGTTTTQGSGGTNASSTSPLVMFTGAGVTVNPKLRAYLACVATVVMGGLFALGT